MLSSVLLLSALLTTPLAVASVGAASVGTVLPMAPATPPGTVAPLPDDLLVTAINRRTQGDVPGAIWAYEQLLAQKKTDARTRAAVEIALGILYLDQGAPQLAGVLFNRARTSGTPVAPWGAWYQATADLARGAWATAASTCTTYRAQWPTAEHADECLVLMGDAWSRAGKRGAAVGAYKTWLDAHPDSPREETLRLRMALAAAVADPKAAVPTLQSLVTNHSYHSTGLTAQATLEELAKKGYNALLPDTPANACALTAEKKRCGFDEEARTRFADLEKKASSDTTIAAWIASQEDTFRWGTKQYERVAADLAIRYAARPDPETAWKRYRALARGGLWAAAGEQLVAGNKDFPTSSRFRNVKVELGRAWLLAGRYADARPIWDELAKGGGSLGKEARWLAAFASYRAGELDDAEARLDKVVAAGGGEADAARYYLWKLHRQKGEDAAAATLAAEIRKDNPNSWYAVLIGTALLDAAALETAGPKTAAAKTAARDHWTTRNGRWPAPAAPKLAAIPVVERGPAPAAAATTGTRASTAAVDWSLLSWGGAPSAGATGQAVAPKPSSPHYHERPDSYAENFLYTREEAWHLLDKLGKENPDAYPWAQAAADLSAAGVYRHSGAIVARMYDAYEAADGHGDVASVALRKADLSVPEWRQVFLFARDDHHAARFSWGTTKLAANEEQRLQAQRSAFPTAWIDAIYRHGESYDVDPLMVLGLMRQESVYRQWALSPVGAIGLMQVMPRTGGRVAALMGDPHYSPSDLEDPTINVRYGVWYLSRLLDRFGGAFPLAVASYNGGPHNVSSWLRPQGEKIAVDDYVEQIPYPETRDYVKKVTGYYATYLALYGPPGGKIAVPANVTLDDPSIIDF